MAWGDLEQMIREERRSGNPVAQLIKSLDLPNNKVTVTLANHLDDDDDDDDDDVDGFDLIGGDGGGAGGGSSKRKSKKNNKAIPVELDLGLSAYANARAHFDRKKKHAAKHDKTLAQNERAVAAAEKRAKETAWPRLFHIHYRFTHSHTYRISSDHNLRVKRGNHTC